MKEKLEMLAPALTLRSVIIVVLEAIIFSVLSEIMYLHTAKPATFSAFIIPWFWMIVLNEALGKISPKLRLKRGEMILVLYAMAIIGGHYYIVKGSASTANLQAIMSGHTGLITSAQSWTVLEAVRDHWSRLTPGFMFPLEGRDLIAFQIWNGKKPGDIFPWSLLTIPIIYWETITILIFIMCISWTFLVIGSSWIEIERLPFPWAVPLTYTIGLLKESEEITSQGEQGSYKPKIFDFKDPLIRAFYIGLLIGFAGSIMPVLAEALPPLAWAGAVQWGYMDVNLYSLAAMFPGANWTLRIHLEYLALWLIMPNDVLWTFIIVQVVLNWIWLYTAVRLGIIPYEPGMEFYVYGGAPGGWEPFSYMIMGTVGVPFFIGVITWWKGRERIRRVWNAIRGKETYVEAGLPLKPVGILSIISTLAFIVLGLASGAAILPFLFYVFWLYFIFWPSAARGWAEVCEAGEGDFDVTRAWVYPYSVGIATGSWSSELPNNNPSWFVQLNIMYHANAGGPWQSYYWPLNASQLISWYKIAYDNKVNMKHIFIGMIIAVIVTTITGFYVSMYLITHGGGIVNTSAETWRPWMIYGGGWQDAWLWRGGTITTAWQWLIAGFFVGLLIYGAKIYIPALPLNVAAFYVACYCANLFWFDALVALIVKTIAVRALGVKQWVRIAVPVVAGICAGLGASYIFAMPIEFFTRSWPKFASLYTP